MGSRCYARLSSRTSFFPSIHLTLNHLLIVDWYYVDALEGGGRGPALYADPEPCAGFAALDAAQRAVDRRLIAYCDGLDAAGASVTVDLVDEDGTFLDAGNLFSVQVNNVAPTVSAVSSRLPRFMAQMAPIVGPRITPTIRAIRSRYLRRSDMLGEG